MDRPETKRALSIAEASKYACVSRGIIEEWLKKRLLPFEELPGKGSGRNKFRRIRRADLDMFLDGHYKEKREAISKPVAVPVVNGQITLLPRKKARE